MKFKNLVIYTKRKSGKVYAKILTCPEMNITEFKNNRNNVSPTRKDSYATVIQFHVCDTFQEAEDFIKTL